MRRVLLLAAALLLTGCASTPAVIAVSPAPSTTLQPMSCHDVGAGARALPDPHCTPGALNPAVNQADIHSTICVSGWSTKQRDQYSEAWFAGKKTEVMAAYGVPTRSRSAYEGDHLVPIELGGLPGGTGFEANYWPELNDHPNSHTLNSKDLVENAAHNAVCYHGMPLATAQKAMETNWVQLGIQLGALKA